MSATAIVGMDFEKGWLVKKMTPFYVGTDASKRFCKGRLKSYRILWKFISKFAKELEIKEVLKNTTSKCPPEINGIHGLNGKKCYNKAPCLVNNRQDFTGMHDLKGNFPYDNFFRKTHARLYFGLRSKESIGREKTKTNKSAHLSNVYSMSKT